MGIQKIDTSEIDEAVKLIWETFLKFEAPDYSPEGVKAFQEFIENKDILSKIEFFGAYENDELKGVIAVRNDRKHICCFFVKQQFQRQGLGRKLWEYIRNISPHNIITVNSSPYAVPIYHKLGFTDTDTEQLRDGIRYTPMQYKRVAMNRLKLIEPTKEYEEQVMAYREILIKNGEGADGCAALEETESYDEWLDFENRLKRKYGVGYTPSTVCLAIRISDNKLIGIIDFRHDLTDFLMKYGGNIGYSIIPSERQKGYAKEMLGLMLDKCRVMGKDKVLITCDKGNIASVKTIIANGGIMENEVPDAASLGKSGLVQRYWIKL